MQANAQKQRQLLLSLYQAAIKAVEGEQAVKQHIATQMPAFQGRMIAIGKAACAMAKGVYASLGNKIHQGLVITKYGHNQDLPCPVIEAGHPVPDENSLKAGSALLEFIEQSPAKEPLLLLISGGASSLVEVLDSDYDLPSLQEFTQLSLSQSMDIQSINRQRRQFSKIKHGGLLSYIGCRPVTQLLISDVLNNSVEIIGSGLLYSAGSSVKTEIIANLDDALNAAESKANELSLPIHRAPSPLSMTVEKAADHCYQLLTQGEPGIYLWGGETTITLPSRAGNGGRNQHLALLMAKKLSGTTTVFLAAGTDGNDGNTMTAGGLVDGSSVQRGTLANVNITDCINHADSHRFLAASEDLIDTGPTGTNVADLYFAIKLPANTSL